MQVRIGRKLVKATRYAVFGQCDGMTLLADYSLLAHAACLQLEHITSAKADDERLWAGLKKREKEKGKRTLWDIIAGASLSQLGVVDRLTWRSMQPLLH